MKTVGTKTADELNQELNVISDNWKLLDEKRQGGADTKIELSRAHAMFVKKRREIEFAERRELPAKMRQARIEALQFGADVLSARREMENNGWVASGRRLPVASMGREQQQPVLEENLVAPGRIAHASDPKEDNHGVHDVGLCL